MDGVIVVVATLAIAVYVTSKHKPKSSIASLRPRTLLYDDGQHVAWARDHTVYHKPTTVAGQSMGLLGTPKHHVVSHSGVLHTRYGAAKKPCGCH